MKILAIETSCDETSAAIIEASPKDKKVKLLSNVVSSSLELHSKTGGIIPEVAAREQVKYIIPVIKQALIESNLYPQASNINFQSSTLYRPDIDAIAVTVGPGLIGSLLVGVETAKTLAYLWRKPVIPINHLLGHIYANFISVMVNGKWQMANILFPAISLIVSGGHTDLVLMKKHNDFEWLGGTRDDAAGEAFDKIGRLLNLPYPGGPAIEKLSERGDVNRFTFPRPMFGSKDFDFSFSGLKAAVWREVNKLNKVRFLTGPRVTADICASVQKSIIEVLVKKTLKATKQYKAKSILLGGGVAANNKLRKQFEFKIKNSKLKIQFFAPAKNLCTDNAAMIGAYAAFNYKPQDPKTITANPELYFDNLI
ncbi:MAG: tRNA (adenosine(37)-N6)-threonylcarbamoyltransferase complex transferase subunit TsaD [Candidatus Levybacteria bacterium]|nr:tRNA (adenosine(37)-N6)-threonylcarbamoyltransferase complex transferase subunit TsaD [Candidatus Levybacteria bacterium]